MICKPCDLGNHHQCVGSPCECKHTNPLWPTKKITVEPKTICGVEYFYPADEIASIFIQLTRRKTLDRETLELIKKLGFEIEVKQIKL